MIVWAIGLNPNVIHVEITSGQIWESYTLIWLVKRFFKDENLSVDFLADSLVCYWVNFLDDLLESNGCGIFMC